ncbi:MAG: hypothetical protein QOD75_2862 [Blastocatellia bacterium]|nr:hypothetical protein [Blastocatellia bacterium]
MNVTGEFRPSRGFLRLLAQKLGNFTQATRGNQAARLWQAVHFFEVGGATSVRVLTISS